MSESLRAWPDVTIEIQGHTDSAGRAEHNQQLSQARAEAVLSYFIAQGISAARMRAVGYGEDQPIAPNNTAAGMAQNRRVAIVRTN